LADASPSRVRIVKLVAALRTQCGEFAKRVKRLCKPRTFPLTTRVPHRARTLKTHKTLDKSSFLRKLLLPTSRV
jgi:hypothetical protein